MPSPFPGMDPFIEGQSWPDFHSRFIGQLGDQLVVQVKPRYIVKLEQDIYLLGGDEGRNEVFIPDVHVKDSGAGVRDGGSETSVATIVPVTLHLPVPKERRQTWLRIIDREERQVVTVIEVLSPTNKSHRRGRRQYLRKRERLLTSVINLVEIDLLRGGRRLPTIEPLMTCDYFAFVSEGMRVPEVDVYGWNLRDRLPSIPVPLARNDDDAMLDLEAAFSAAYDRAGYEYALNYEDEVRPKMNESDAAWVRDRLEAHCHAR